MATFDLSAKRRVKTREIPKWKHNSENKHDHLFLFIIAIFVFLVPLFYHKTDEHDVGFITSADPRADALPRFFEQNEFALLPKTPSVGVGVLRP